jgi:antibiotic biosynthesis monooxygenase (ABM) superfamily enzyme
MLYITQLIYIQPGQEACFNEFESHAIPIIAKYKGELVLRVRPETGSYIERSIEPPYEIHLVRFECEADFAAFMADEERGKYLHLKEQSIRASLLVKGERL